MAAPPHSLPGSLKIPVPVLDDDVLEDDTGQPGSDTIGAVRELPLRLPVIEPCCAFPPRITCQTLATLMRDPCKSPYTSIHILDGRTVKEFVGGHLHGAKNIESHDVVRIINTLFKDVSGDTKNTLIVCHCEFSSRRGPDLACKIREIDRKMKGSEYPDLFYPELYVLDGGYCEFYKLFPSLCTGGYLKKEQWDMMNRRMRRCQSQRLSVSVRMPESSVALPRSVETSPVEASRDLFETVMFEQPGSPQEHQWQ